MQPFDGPTTAFVCDDCGTVAFGDEEPRCCGRPMGSVEAPVETTDAVASPTLDDLLRTVFDMTDTELELCLCVMAGGELTVKELSATTGYDRSVVARHLNHLADLAVLDKRRRLLETGGEVYVYTPVPPEEIRHTFTRLFLDWVVDAARLLDDLSREKVESIVEPATDEPQWKLFRREA
jgi:predicted transcriptional regulator